MSKKKQVTFADIANTPIFQKLQYQDTSIILILLPWKTRKRFHKLLTHLDIKRISWQKFWQMEKVNLLESLFRIFTCTIILRC